MEGKSVGAFTDAVTETDRAGGLTVPVLVDGWQMECCGESPAERERVSWRLGWAAWCSSLLDTDWSVTAEVEPSSLELPQPTETSSSECSAIARTGGLSVFISMPPPIPQRLVLKGVVHEDHHIDIPSGAPKTTGIITRVRLTSWEYVQTGDRWEPVPGTAEFVDVLKAPEFLPYRPPPAGALRWRHTAAVLADLRVENSE